MQRSNKLLLALLLCWVALAPLQASAQVVTPISGGSGSCTGAFCAAIAPLAANLGGNGLDNSGSTGVPLWTAGVQSILATSGTGNVVRVASPALTGTATAVALTLSGTLTTNVTGGGVQCLHASNTGVVTGTGSDCGAGGGGTPGGSNTQVQYNNSGAFGGISGVTTNGTTLTMASPVMTGTATVAAATLSSTLTTNVTGSTQCLNANTSGVVSGFASPCTPNGTGAVITSNPTIVAADWAAFKLFTGNAAALTYTLPVSSALQANGGGIIVASQANSFTVTPNVADTMNGGSAGVGVVGNFLSIVTTDGLGNDFMTVFGTAAGKNTGTSGATLGLLNGNLTFSGTNAYGTPTSITLTNAIGLPVSTGINGLGTGVATALAANVSGTGAICLASGSACAGGGSGLTVGTTTITSGTNGRVEFNNSGVLGEYPITGTTNVVMSAGPTLSGTVHGNVTLDGNLTFSANGGTSTPGLNITGTPFAGTGTTSFPQLYLSGGAAVTTFSTAGTEFGINAPSGFTGNLIDAFTNGGTSVFQVTSSGTIATTSGAQINGNFILLGSGNNFQFRGGGTTLASPSNNNLLFGLNQASPVAQSFTVGGNFAGSATNNAGADFSLQMSASTGTALGGAFIVQGTNTGSTGSTLNAFTNIFKVTANGDVYFSGGAIPVVTGTGSPTITSGSTDTSGEVTGGTLATSIIITFAKAKTNAPFCVVTSQSAAITYTLSTTAITISLTATTGEKIDYICGQH